MISEDIEHKLLSGSPIYIGDCPTYKVSLQDMADNGFTKMQNVIALMALDDSSAPKFINGDENIELSTYSVLAIGVLQDLYKKRQGESHDDMLYDSVLTFLSLFFRREVCFDENDGFVVKNQKGEPVFVLNESNYNKFRSVLRCRNCLGDEGEFDGDNPANDMVAKLLAKRKMLREKVSNSKKAQGNSDLTTADLISIFAEAEGMPPEDVYRNYDIYQLNNQFSRLRIMDDYHVNVKALLAGAKSEDIKLRHWLSKINNKNDE